MACDLDAIRAKIELLNRIREEDLSAAETSAGEIAHEHYRLAAKVQEEVNGLLQQLDICTTVPDADDPPLEIPFEVSRSFVGFEIAGDFPLTIVGHSGTLGFWFSASRQHVRIHEWPRIGRVFYWPGSLRDGYVVLSTDGRMARQMSGEVFEDNEGRQMRIPIILNVHHQGNAFPSSARLTLRTASPPVNWPGRDEVWAKGSPFFMNERGRAAVGLVGEGTFSGGPFGGIPCRYLLEGSFPEIP